MDPDILEHLFRLSPRDAATVVRLALNPDCAARVREFGLRRAKGRTYVVQHLDSDRRRSFGPPAPIADAFRAMAAIVDSFRQEPMDLKSVTLRTVVVANAGAGDVENESVADPAKGPTRQPSPPTVMDPFNTPANISAPDPTGAPVNEPVKAPAMDPVKAPTIQDGEPSESESAKAPVICPVTTSIKLGDGAPTDDPAKTAVAAPVTSPVIAPAKASAPDVTGASVNDPVKSPVMVPVKTPSILGDVTLAATSVSPSVNTPVTTPIKLGGEAPADDTAKKEVTPPVTSTVIAPGIQPVSCPTGAPVNEPVKSPVMGPATGTVAPASTAPGVTPHSRPAPGQSVFTSAPTKRQVPVASFLERLGVQIYRETHYLDDQAHLLRLIVKPGATSWAKTGLTPPCFTRTDKDGMIFFERLVSCATSQSIDSLLGSAVTFLCVGGDLEKVKILPSVYADLVKEGGGS